MRYISMAYTWEEALIVESFLESSGVNCKVEQESLAKVYGLSADGLGLIKICVEEGEAKRVKGLLEGLDEA